MCTIQVVTQDCESGLSATLDWLTFRSSPSRRRSSVIEVVKTTDWVKVFRVVSMVLFIAYPSVSVKIFRLFRCVEVL